MDDKINDVVKLLAKEFGFPEKKAFDLINRELVDKNDEHKEEVENRDIYFDVEYRKCTNEIINYPHCIPYCGIIYDNLCKGIVYNHGLYTQCKKNVSGEFCNNCQKQKYGNIEDRKRFEVGKFVTNNGKKEVKYEDYVKKSGLPINDIKLFMKNNNLNYPFDKCNNEEKKPQKRGRPLKDTKKEVTTKIDKADDMINTINANKQKEERVYESRVELEESELEEELEGIKIDGKMLYKTTSKDVEGFGYDNEGNVILFNKELEVIGILVNDKIKYI